MRRERRRLRSFFHKWRGAVSPQLLARAGFFYVGPADRVRCFCCGGVLRSWEPGDHPAGEHRKFFPSCPFVLGREVGNVPLAEGSDSVDGQILVQLQRLPGEDEEEAAEEDELQPVYPQLADQRHRLATYRSWPTYTVSPEELASAGFFYTGHRDNVRCYHCDGELRNWEMGDEPWREHAKWFPRCKFLIESMGPAYIRSVQDALLSSPDTTPEFQRVSDGDGSPISQSEQSQDAPTQTPAAGPQTPKNTGPVLSAEEELRQLKDERMCKVCMDKDVSILFVPCGHLVVCMDCAPNLRHCPICRAIIRGSVRALMC
ncbi:baculoviral IAP repeat-containing protein 7 [Gastrophryne carolinensis]